MPDANSYKFSYQELLEYMIRSANVKTGRWQLTVNFTFSGLNFGISPDTVLPGALVGIESFGITAALPDAPPALCMDAESVWAKGSAE